MKYVVCWLLLYLLIDLFTIYLSYFEKVIDEQRVHKMRGYLMDMSELIARVVDTMDKNTDMIWAEDQETTHMMHM